MKELFKELFEFNYRTNQQLGMLLQENAGKVSEKALKLYSHILNAHHIWNNRIETITPAFAVWDAHPVQDFRKIDQENYEQTSGILNRLDLEEKVNYPKLRDRPFDKRVWQVLFHVVNHSTYHRGQIATECRQSGIDPLLTEYILFEKQRDPS